MNYLREPLETLEGFIKIGDLILYDGGHCRAGNRVFDQGVPIDGHVFGGACLLRRRVDAPELVEVQDGAQTLQFEYSSLHATWYRLTPLESPRFEALKHRFGAYPANLAYQFLRGLESYQNLFVAQVATTPRVLLTIALSYLRFLISLVPFVLLLLLLKLIGFLAGN